MAEGGREFGYDDLILDHNIDNDGEEQEVDTTRSFRPGAASTPYHGGEQLQMQTMMQEQEGLPDTSYEETPLLGDFIHKDERVDAVETAKNFIKSRFPRVDFGKLGPIGFSKRGTGHIVSFGSKGGESKIFKADKSGFLKSFTDKFSASLGPRAEEIIAQDHNTIQEQRQRAADADEQLRRANALAAEREKEKQEVENLRQQVERTQARIDGLQEEQGSNLESEAELNRLKLLKKNYQKDLDSKKKSVASLEKEAKNKEKAQAKVDRERTKLAQIEKERNEIEERLNSTKPLDELNERERELKRQNEEDRAIIQDENAAPSEREAAEARVEERNEELARLQTQIGEREAAMPLRERVKEIFKKYGVTVTAIFLAAGVTIGAVIGAITNALKTMGNQLASGLKTLGAKAASALPGLIGAIVSFLFKTAGQAIGYLAEHTWLLILAVVAFLFQKFMKKR